MYQIHTNRIDGKNRTVNLHDLPIGNTYCHRLTRDDLLREVVALNVPGVEPWMGHSTWTLHYVMACGASNVGNRRRPNEKRQEEHPEMGTS